MKMPNRDKQVGNPDDFDGGTKTDERALAAGGAQ